MKKAALGRMRRACNGSGRLCLALLTLLLVSGVPALAQDQLEQARQLMQKGRYKKAEDLLSPQSTDAYELRLLLDLAQRSGRLADAGRHANRLLLLYQSGRFSQPGQMAQAAYAAWRLDRWHEADEIYIAAAEKEGAPASLYIDWGNLYLDKYAVAEAEEIFQDAIKASPEDSPPAAAFVGLAQAGKTLSRPGGEQVLERALEIDPDNLEAISLKVGWAIPSESWEEAEKWIDKGLKVNPNYLPLLEQRTIMHYFRGESPKYHQARQAVLKINPNDADLFEDLGNTAVNMRRMEEADRFFREAVRLNPRQWSALAAQGINMLRLGQDEGKQVLEKAFENDPFNIWALNTLRLLDSFENFTEFETEHFRVRLHKKEADALRPYVEDLLERCLTTLEEKYDHQISGKYVFEMYPDHEDFAVRTLGMPGLGALGAAFGRVVAMDSPSGRPKGEFHWGSTLWHEVAHVVALSLSDQKVPRWFTEGLSMMEERLAYEGWGEYINTTYISAYRDGQLLPLERLNDGFQRPKSPLQIQLSYLQAGWVCEFLASRYGFSKIRDMLLAYADDKTTEEVFQTVLGNSIEEVDAEFQKEMKETLDPLAERLGPIEKQAEEGEEGAAAQILIPGPEVLAGDEADNYFANLRRGRKLVEEGKLEEAAPFLEKAVELFPSFAGKNSPYELLAKIYRENGDARKTASILERWWKVSPKHADIAVELSLLLIEQQEAEKAVRYLEESMYSDPLRNDSHTHLGDLYLQREQPEKAVREFEVLLSLNPNDLAGARYRLARALFQTG
ncbi:MAG: tetratricopeptide repeat protein, partial [Acidobacteriota bacterium]